MACYWVGCCVYMSGYTKTPTESYRLTGGNISGSCIMTSSQYNWTNGLVLGDQLASGGSVADGNRRIFWRSGVTSTLPSGFPTGGSGTWACYVFAKGIGHQMNSAGTPTTAITHTSMTNNMNFTRYPHTEAAMNTSNTFVYSKNQQNYFKVVVRNDMARYHISGKSGYIVTYTTANKVGITGKYGYTLILYSGTDVSMPITVEREGSNPESTTCSPNDQRILWPSSNGLIATHENLAAVLHPTNTLAAYKTYAYGDTIGGVVSLVSGASYASKQLVQLHHLRTGPNAKAYYLDETIMGVNVLDGTRSFTGFTTNVTAPSGGATFKSIGTVPVAHSGTITISNLDGFHVVFENIGSNTVPGAELTVGLQVATDSSYTNIIHQEEFWYDPSDTEVQHQYSGTFQSFSAEVSSGTLYFRYRIYWDVFTSPYSNSAVVATNSDTWGALFSLVYEG